jgi:hypothetical protein
MATKVYPPMSKSVTLSTSYLANDYEVHGAKAMRIGLDDVTIAFTVRVQIENGGDQAEYPCVAGEKFDLQNITPTATVFVNVKAASGTPKGVFAFV